MQRGNRPVVWCVWDSFQVVKSKTFENDIFFRFLPLLLDGTGLGGMIPGQVASPGQWTLPTFQHWKCFMYSLSHKRIFFLEEDRLLNYIHLLFRSIDVLMSALLHSIAWGCLWNYWHYHRRCDCSCGVQRRRWKSRNICNLQTWGGVGARRALGGPWVPTTLCKLRKTVCKPLHPLLWPPLFWDSVLFLSRFS